MIRHGKDPAAVVDAAADALAPSPRRVARAQVVIAALAFVVVTLLVVMVLSLYALLDSRHDAQVDFNRRFDAGLCQAIDFAADPKQPVTPRELAFRHHFGCKSRVAK